MQLKKLDADLSVCKVASTADLDLQADLYFIGRTDEEISLVCRTGNVPAHTTAREDGWKAFRIEGELDFSLIGILSRLTAVLAAGGIGVFAVSTFNTDYVLVKAEAFDRALSLLCGEGYEIC